MNLARATTGARWIAMIAAATALGGCMKTATYGTGQMPEVAMFKEMTGGLLGRGEAKKPIDYQPRAPLVLPPSAGALPQPVDAASASNPDWPVEPGTTTLASAAQLDDDPRNDVSQAEYRRLRPLSEAMSAGSRRQLNEVSGKDDYYQNIVHGGESRRRFLQEINEANGVGRTERRYLTDPPTEFRQPAATAPTEFADVKKKKKSFFAGLFGG